MMKILLIEDEPTLRADLERRLKRAGHTVTAAADGPDGSWHWSESAFDLVLLDLGLPGRSGLDILRERRDAGDHTPVLVLTARNAWHERVEGLRAGADDYLGKPFHPEELLARLEALQRRRLGVGGRRLELGDLALDLERRVLLTAGGEQPLTATEFRLLTQLMQTPGRVWSKEELMRYLGQTETVHNPNLVEVYIGRLRRLLGRSRIETLRGQGYRLREHADG